MIRSIQGASAALAPTELWKFAFPETIVRAVQPAAGPEFYLHPRYRSRSPLDAMLQKVAAGSDQFITEKYADQIASILNAWSAALRTSPANVGALRKFLADDFSGYSPSEAKQEQLRSRIIDISKQSFPQPALNASQFLDELRTDWSGFIRIKTADFQITRIDANLPQLLTRIRYEFVGNGKNFHLEQRTGEWEIEWAVTSSAEFRVTDWKAIGETRSVAATPIFTDIAPRAFSACASFPDQLLHGSDYWRTLLDGATGIDVYGHNGVAVGDIDNDGFDDLYICQPAGIPNRLYRNRGNGTFEDITQSVGVGLLENTTNALFVDIDNDGRQDLIVVLTSGPMLFLNQGEGKFRQKPDAFKFATSPQGTFTGAAVADYDRDGWLDIYFSLYTFYQGTDQYRYPLPYYDANNGPPNFMMRNNRDGTFVDVTGATGLDKSNSRYSFCCGWNDYNNDGWPDLYVVNDFGRKNLYRNNGDGTFTDVAAELGAEDVGAGMSVCWFDYDNDGKDDLYVANMWTAAGERISMQKIFQETAPASIRALYQQHAMGNSLLRNNGKNFQDTTETAGVALGRWAWSSDAWDVDHDGFLDIYVTNGMVSGLSKPDLNSFFWRQTVANSPEDATPSDNYEKGWNAVNELIRADGTWSGYERNVFYLNHGNGIFSDVSGAAGLDFIEDGRAFALSDFDHDGRQEVFLKSRNAPQLRLLKNVIKELPPSICFRLRGTKSNRDAIGAVVTLKSGQLPQRRTLQAGSGFLSQHSKDLMFGLGDAREASVSIRWPSGLVQEFHNLPPDHLIVVEEGLSKFEILAFSKNTPGAAGTLETDQTEATANAERLQPEPLPEVVETWLLSPIAAPDFSLPDSAGKTWTLWSLKGQTVFLSFCTSKSPTCREWLLALQNKHREWSAEGISLFAINVDDWLKEQNQAQGFAKDAANLQLSFPVLRGSDDVSAIYNIVFRYIFDRHRDLPLPTSFLISAQGEIVKVYQGTVNIEAIDHDFRQIPQTSAERLAAALPFPGITAITDFPRNYLSFGSIFFQRGYYEQAAASFEQARRDDPNGAEPEYGLGSVYLQLGNDDEARKCFEQATKLQARYPETLPNAWNNLGLLATRAGQMDQAVEYFQQALKLSPAYLIALENLGNAYRRQRKWEDARQVLERAVVVDPQSPEANYSLGMVFAQMNDSDRAYDYLQRALKLRPDYPEALNNLGVLYLRTNRRNEAVDEFEQCIHVAPDFDQSYLNLARVYALENSPGKARSILLELLKRHPSHPQAEAMLKELPQ